MHIYILYVCVYTSVYIYQSVSRSVSQSVCPSVFLSVCLFVCAVVDQHSFICKRPFFAEKKIHWRIFREPNVYLNLSRGSRGLMFKSFAKTFAQNILVITFAMDSLYTLHGPLDRQSCIHLSKYHYHNTYLYLHLRHRKKTMGGICSWYPIM